MPPNRGLPSQEGHKRPAFKGTGRQPSSEKKKAARDKRGKNYHPKAWRSKALRSEKGNFSPSRGKGKGKESQCCSRDKGGKLRFRRRKISRKKN